jgi:hypothetical protein
MEDGLIRFIEQNWGAGPSWLAACVWGGAGLVGIGWTRDRFSTEVVVYCRNRGH